VSGFFILRRKVKNQKGIAMASTDSAKPTRRTILSLDTWAVILALSLAGLVRIGLLKYITW
jgi:hypothetical protein